MLSIVYDQRSKSALWNRVTKVTELVSLSMIQSTFVTHNCYTYRSILTPHST